jgi:hypothetical protein
MENIRAACRLYDKAYVVDFYHLYSAAKFVDSVHPPFGDPEYAARHYKAIFDCLEEAHKGAR